MGDKKLLFISGCGRSGTSVLTEIIGAHHQIVLGIERYNKLMKECAFALSPSHFVKERFTTMYEGDTFYDDFNKFKAHENAVEKFDQAVYVGMKYPLFDRIYQLMQANFGTFKYLYIYRNIYDVAESWNRRAEKGGNWPKEKNYLKAVQRWNDSLGNTLMELRNGVDVICISYEDLLYSEKSIQPIFDKLGLPIDKNVMRELAKARNIAPSIKSAKESLSESEREYIRNNAKFELYDEIHSKYNILRRTVGSWQRPGTILHIGTEKTGTTTIQEFLHLNRNLLADNGFYFPKSIGIRNHRPLASWCLPDHRDDVYLRMNNLTGSHERKAWKEAFIEKFETELKSLKPEIKQVIISSEHFSSLLNQPSEIEILKSILNKWFTNINVIVYLRRQDLLAVSLFNTSLKAGIRQKRFFVGLSPQYKYFGYKILLNKWRLIFGKENIHLVIFEKEEWKNNDLLADFCHICRLPEGVCYKLPENMNLSYSETTQEVAMLFNDLTRNDLSGNDLKTIRQIRHQLMETINKKYPGPAKKPLRQEAIDYYKIFKESNDDVAQEWFGRENLFSEDFSMYLETYTTDRQTPDYEKILFEELKDKMEILKPFLA